MSKLYTIKIQEAHERTGIPIRSLRDLVKSGKIEGAKPAKEILIFWQSLVDYIERNKIKPKAS